MQSFQIIGEAPLKASTVTHCWEPLLGSCNGMQEGVRKDALLGVVVGELQLDSGRGLGIAVKQHIEVLLAMGDNPISPLQWPRG